MDLGAVLTELFVSSGAVAPGPVSLVKVTMALRRPIAQCLIDSTHKQEPTSRG